MPSRSPLLQSSLELFGHSISHFIAGGELDRKITILHLANSVELLLKDLVLEEGVSIYKNPKETLSVHGCIEALKKKNIQLPYLNKLELLIDERNALQHRFGSPNEISTTFYMNLAAAFFRVILKKKYSRKFNEVIPQYTPKADWDVFMVRIPTTESGLHDLKGLAHVHPLQALLSVETYFEELINRTIDDIYGQESMTRRSRLTWYDHFVFVGEKEGFLLRERLDAFDGLRNRVSLGQDEPKVSEVIDGIEVVADFEKALEKIDFENLRVIERKRFKEQKEKADAALNYFRKNV